MSGSPKIKWDEEKFKQIEYLAGTGLNNRDIANFLSIAESTFYSYVKNYPDLGQRIQIGKAKGKQGLLQTAHKKAIVKEDTFLITWLLSRLHGMGEKTSEEEQSFKKFNLEEIKYELSEAETKNKETVKRLEQKEQFQSSS